MPSRSGSGTVPAPAPGTAPAYSGFTNSHYSTAASLGRERTGTRRKLPGVSGRSVLGRTGGDRSGSALSERGSWWMERRTWLIAALAIVLLALGVRIWEVEPTSSYRP